MPIQIDRIRADIQAIARFTETPGAGATRPTFSQEWAKARDYVIEQAKAAGCVVTIDAAGNAHARPAVVASSTPVYLCGSHVDTVPHGGDYDGVAGVVVALEILRSSQEDGVTLPLELIVFAEEEGPTFGLGMLGSRAWTGELDVDQLGKLKNADQKSYLEAGQPYGVDASRLGVDRLDPKRYLGLIEVHIEQGPGMWRRDQKLAVVRSIAGRLQYQVTIQGQANHAGATSMADRSDALVTTARIITLLDNRAGEWPDAVVTVGRIENQPNAINVIPERVVFTIDLRAPEDATLRQADQRIESIIQGVCEARGQTFEICRTESIPARPMDSKLVVRFSQGGLPITISGALHDSAVIAPFLPTVMLFVPSRDGISHNPAEFSRVEDIAEAARTVERVVRRPTLAQLNAMSREDFVAVCGRFFEHSPWIAQRTWDRKPFASINDLYEKLCGTLAKSNDVERLDLIRAHPDLVGRLARENQLTRESTGEQAAAGLDALTPQEVSLFEKFNTEYRRKFGFPFVICARQNRKDAILAAFPVRLKNSTAQETATAIAEIEKIARLRLEDAVWET